MTVLVGRRQLIDGQFNARIMNRSCDDLRGGGGEKLGDELPVFLTAHL
jgi:hypothetical protein